MPFLGFIIQKKCRIRKNLVFFLLFIRTLLFKPKLHTIAIQIKSRLKKQVAYTVYFFGKYKILFYNSSCFISSLAKKQQKTLRNYAS